MNGRGTDSQALSSRRRQDRPHPLDVLQEAWRSRWHLANAQGGLLCVPVIAAWIFVGVLRQRDSWAVLAVAGAVSVGFGSFQRLGQSRLGPMLITLAGMTFATFAGSVVGHDNWVGLTLLAMLCGYVFGLITLFGYSTWWIGLQCMVALLVYGAHPGNARVAGVNALAVLAGGCSQLAFTFAVQPFAAQWFRKQQQPPFNHTDSVLADLERYSNPKNPQGRYAPRVAVAMMVCMLIDHFWAIPNGYWIPMTAAILLKPDFHEATLRGINRLMGTIVGAGLTTLLLAICRPQEWTRGLLLLAAIWACFALQRVNYAIFVTCITTYVALLFSILGLPEPVVAWHRVLATLTGAAVALLVSLPFNAQAPAPAPGSQDRLASGDGNGRA